MIYVIFGLGFLGLLVSIAVIGVLSLFVLFITGFRAAVQLLEKSKEGEL